MYKYLQILFITCFMYGCGFHLAGEGTFADELKNTYIHQGSSSKDMLRLLKRNLESNQINVVDNKSATALLRILNEETEKVVLTVDNDGKAREFELLLKIKFDVRRSDNTVLLDQQTVALSRDFVFDKSDLLGANEEEQQLYDEMRRDAAKLIVYRLQAI